MCSNELLMSKRLVAGRSTTIRLLCECDSCRSFRSYGDRRWCSIHTSAGKRCSISDSMLPEPGGKVTRGITTLSWLAIRPYAIQYSFIVAWAANASYKRNKLCQRPSRQDVIRRRIRDVPYLICVFVPCTAHVWRMYNPLSEWGVWEVVVCGRVVEGRRRRTVPRTTADSLDNRLSVTAGAVDHAQS